MTMSLQAVHLVNTLISALRSIGRRCRDYHGYIG